MSNNKQSMKLYTEEQVKRAMYLAHCNTEEEVLAGLTTIELPSNEEIEQIADACHPYAEQIGGDIYVAYRAFKQGLQLMRDKIQGGNK